MYKTKEFMKDMDKITLLHMRDDDGMTYAEMAAALGCSKKTLINILGPMTPEERKRRRLEGIKRSLEASRANSDTMQHSLNARFAVNNHTCIFSTLLLQWPIVKDTDSTGTKRYLYLHMSALANC